MYRWVWSRNTSRTLSLYNDAEPGRRRAGEFGSAWHFLQCVRDQRPACSQTPCFVVCFFVESSVSCQAAANRCCSEGGKQAAFNPYLTGGVWDSGPGLMLQEDHQRRTVYSRIQRAGEPASFTLSVTTFWPAFSPVSVTVYQHITVNVIHSLLLFLFYILFHQFGHFNPNVLQIRHQHSVSAYLNPYMLTCVDLLHDLLFLQISFTARQMCLMKTGKIENNEL